MKRPIVILSTLLAALTALARCSEEKTAEERFIWVSPDGSDTADGSKTAPLASLDGARQKARALAAEAKGPITVNIRGGEYFFTEPVVFDADDSGSADAPVTYRAYNGEDVRFYGGVKVDPALLTKAEEAVASRVIDETAASALMQMDLSGVFEDSIPHISKFGNTSDEANCPVEIYVEGIALTRSRWPNEGDEENYLRVDKSDLHILDDQTVNLCYNDLLAQRMKLWSDEAFRDLHMFGFLVFDWTNDIYDASEVDTEAKTIHLKGGRRYFSHLLRGEGYDARRYYLFNLVEEIDVAGESYIDRERKMVYFYPKEGANLNDIFVSTFYGSMLQFTDTKHIVIDGIKFLYTRSAPIAATNVDTFNLINCEIMHTSSNAAQLDGIRITVDSCHIYDTAQGGIYISGGDRPTLTSGESVISNCEIHAISGAEEPYTPGINAQSLGLIIRNNELYDCIHEMIAVGTNDVVIEYNELYNCVTESADMGAIYFGRNPSLMGTVIRSNYFHDIGNPYGGIGQQSIFIDDGNNGALIHGNIFHKGTFDSAAIKTHGAQFSLMTNNIFLDMPAAYINEDWQGNGVRGRQNQWFAVIYDKDEQFQHATLDRLAAADFDNEIWHARYDGTIWGQLYDYIDTEKIAAYADKTYEEILAIADKEAPVKSNVLNGNVLVNVQENYIGGRCDYENNHETRDTAIFSDAATYQLTDEALANIRELYPSFEQIPFDKIGIGNND